LGAIRCTSKEEHVKIGIWIPSVRHMARPDAIRDSIVRAERLGYDSVWTIDHVIAPLANREQFGLIYDPFVVMALAAGLTERVQIGVSVLVLPYRHPALVAKMVASLDDLSGGRIVFGVGAGWNRAESTILNVPFDERGAMTDEYLRAMRELWTSSAPSFAGRYVSFADVESRPVPAQKPHPPIWVGGSSPAALRRTAEFGDAWHPINRTSAELQAGMAEIARLGERFGRVAPPTLCPRVDARLVLERPGQPGPGPRRAPAGGHAGAHGRADRGAPGARRRAPGAGVRRPRRGALRGPG